jgi:DNA polymerase-3 subunit delta'
MTPNCAFDDLLGQSRAASYLQRAVTNDAVSHAYLFVGPTGVGKKKAARALACALICADGGCGGCEACARIKREVHPDVHVLVPVGSSGYLVEQIRDVVGDIYLTSIEGGKRVYIFDRADTFNAASANAFLKTLEEPPDGVVMILLADDADAVIDTIASRCQLIRFQRVPESRAVELLVSRTGASAEQAMEALAATGGVLGRAQDYLNSPQRRQARELVVRTMPNLTVMDAADVLDSAREMLESARVPLEGLKAAQDAESRERAEFLGKAAKGGRELEERFKRELTSREREGLLEVLLVVESWLRDCLVLSQGMPQLAVNRDVIDTTQPVARIMTPQAAVRALGSVDEARRLLSRNVTPQLVVETMLFDIREVLLCPR